MTTTIEIKEETFNLLQQYKQLSKAEQYDDLITAMIQIWVRIRQLDAPQP